MNTKREHRAAAGLKHAALALAAACVLSSGSALSQSGQKPVQLVVPAAPGGSTDLAARIIAEKLGPRLNRQFIIVNRAGASMQIGFQAVLDAPADGNTLLITPSGPVTIAPHLSQLPYKPLGDLAPVAMVVRVPAAIAVSGSSKIQSLQQLIDASKTAPGGLSYAVSAIGTHMHLAGELLKNLAGAQLRVIAYRGTAPATTAIAAGEVDLGISDLSTLLPWAQSGKIRILAVTDSARAAAAPSVPTVSETGLKEYSADAWIGMFARPAVSQDWRERLNSEIGEVLKMADVKAALNKLGLDPFVLALPQMSRFLDEDSAKWAKTIKASNIKIE
jgi:tripartite-type tricarboxylate transporter receptor subunit TctC